MVNDRLAQLSSEYDLATSSWENPKNNHHVWGQLVGNDKQAFRDYKLHIKLPLERIMRPEHPALPYRRRSDEEKTVLHWGQRKLMISEIEFLTKFGNLANIVVYAGAAPGTHIKLLSRMFKQHTFHLYDTAEFSVKKSKNIFIHNQLFTKDVAKEWRGIDTLFISDVRTSECYFANVFDQEIEMDMGAQMDWCEIMNPKMSSLKFRLPYTDGITEYYSGSIYYAVWGPVTTTETRLFTDCKSKQMYDHTDYGRKLFYFNTVTRISLFDHPINTVEGLDHCYDCSAEVHVISEYLSTVGWGGENPLQTDSETFTEAIAKTIQTISTISDKRTLLTGNEDAGKKFFEITLRKVLKSSTPVTISPEYLPKSFPIPGPEGNKNRKRKLPIEESAEEATPVCKKNKLC